MSWTRYQRNFRWKSARNTRGLNISLRRWQIQMRRLDFISKTTVLQSISRSDINLPIGIQSKAGELVGMVFCKQRQKKAGLSPCPLRSTHLTLESFALIGNQVSIIFFITKLLGLQLTLGYPGHYCLIDSVTSADPKDPYRKLFIPVSVLYHLFYATIEHYVYKSYSSCWSLG